MATERYSDRFGFPVAGELRAATERLLSATSTSTPRPLWLETISRIATSLGGEPQAVQPFVAAWRALYTVTLYLDHLQDGDPLGDSWLEELPPAQQYHLAFSVYVAAQHFLAQLDTRAIPLGRILRLQRFWAISVAQLANGQYCDLTASLPTHSAAPLDAYEQIAAQKTGTTFALAFGGVARLVTDDEAQVRALTNTGTVYGMLLQYQDDLLDRAGQEHQPETMTFSRTLLAAHPKLAARGEGAVEIFWAAICMGYAEVLDGLLAPLPVETRRIVIDLLRSSFGETAAPAETTEL